MRGSIKPLKRGSYQLTFDMGREPDPLTGRARRRQKCITFTPKAGTPKKEARQQAEAKLAELLNSFANGTFVEPTTTTFAEYLRDYTEKAVKPPMRTPATYRSYLWVVDHVAKSPLGALPLSKLRPTHLERHYADLKLTPSSVSVQHALIRRALQTAVRDRLIATNPATAVSKVRVGKDRPQVREHCWTADEARSFLAAAKRGSPQEAAFYALALETGARKGELHGLKWADVDLDAATATIARQLLAPTVPPEYGPPKNGTTRSVDLSAGTVALLKAHKKAQAALKMANRMTYRDHGLVFALEAEHLCMPGGKLGDPMRPSRLADHDFKRLTKAAGLKPIKFHGLRHTCATLALGNGAPVHVVAARLGHMDATVTLRVYAHALPSQQRHAADRLGAVLHG
jgi:integrase